MLCATFCFVKHSSNNECLFGLVKNKGLFNLNLNTKEYMILLLLSLEFILILYIWIRYANCSILLDFASTSVYEQRLKAREFPMSTLTKYLFSSSKYVLPVLLAYYLSLKRYLFVFLIAFFSVISYGIDCSKG